MTVWLLTWLWQGLALTTLVALVMRLESRAINAPTRHVIWWSTLAGVMWLGWISSPYWGLPPVPVRGADPIGPSFASEPLFHAPSVAPLLISAFLGVWVAIAWVKLVRLVPSLHALYALRDRCRPFPAQIEARQPCRTGRVRCGAGRHRARIRSSVHRASHIARGGAQRR